MKKKDKNNWSSKLSKRFNKGMNPFQNLIQAYQNKTIFLWNKMNLFEICQIYIKDQIIQLYNKQ